MVEKRGIKMANSKWVRDNHKLKGEALRTYLEEYAKKHFWEGCSGCAGKNAWGIHLHLCNGL